METQLIIVITLIVLAVVDLTVGVANDAVNFLNSAIGSKAASFKLIMIIAAIGVMVGVTFSSGMMEVARKGIFNPEYFLMPELLIIFVAVMFQDILLLDLFNTFGLPTSTTVSIVFGLFGAALAMTFIKLTSAGENLDLVFTYINTGNVLKIVSAILLSIVIAFVVGSIIQYLTRLLFTFDFQKRFKRYGAIWSGLAVTFLTFFILLKGAKGASFMSEGVSDWIKNNLWMVFIYSFVGWTVILQLVMWFTKWNVLRFIVLFGTFSLAMAFAANDLVNFIGAPMAGLNAYLFAAQTDNPMTASMEIMRQPVQANTWFLLIAGAIMVTTLFLSRKAKSVAYTTIRLGRQSEGYEHFESNAIARAIVRMVLVVFDFIRKITPDGLRKKVAARFDATKFKPPQTKDGVPPAFDLVRAAVILMVSAALISFATSLKLPLSTTYVTFIVAMAAALPDKAWGRESAVYRVSGVVTVIGGWFFTAFMASLVAMIIAAIIYYTDLYGIIGLILLSGFVLLYTTKFAKNKETEETAAEMQIQIENSSAGQIVKALFDSISDFLTSVSDITDQSYKGLSNANLKKLKKAKKKANKLNTKSAVLIRDILKLLRFAPDEEIRSGPAYTKALSSFQDISDRLGFLTKQNYDYVDNNHQELTKDQIEEIEHIQISLDKLTAGAADIIQHMKFNQMDILAVHRDELLDVVRKCNRTQLQRIKKSQSNMKRSMLYLSILGDVESMADHVIQICYNCRLVNEVISKHIDALDVAPKED
ncbi:MAG: inorganic phosphate transporter [Candidatus Kapaibacterium sp.]